MVVLRSTALVDAPAPTVGAALLHTRTAETGLARIGIHGRSAGQAGELLIPGDELVFRWGPPGCNLGPSLRTRMVDASARQVSSTLVGGMARSLRHESLLADLGDRTLITESISWESPFGVLGRLANVLFVRHVVLAVLQRRLSLVRALAESWATREVVVGAVIVRDGRLLAQQRRYPERDAGRWELPGGRVEPGETEEDAIVRECKEELDVDVRPLSRIGTDVPLGTDKLLHLYGAELVEVDAEPTSLDHHAVRWIERGELGELDWLDADRLLLHALRDALSPSTQP